MPIQIGTFSRGGRPSEGKMRERQPPSVYWTSSGTSSAVMSVPVNGGSLLQLASGSSDQTRHAIAVDATSVYWTNSDGTIMKVAIGGGNAVTLASGQGDSVGIAVDATSAYWTSPATYSVMKLTPK
jgi:hypothetical protein